MKIDKRNVEIALGRLALSKYGFKRISDDSVKVMDFIRTLEIKEEDLTYSFILCDLLLHNISDNKKEILDSVNEQILSVSQDEGLN